LAFAFALAFSSRPSSPEMIFSFLPPESPKIFIILKNCSAGNKIFRTSGIPYCPEYNLWRRRDRNKYNLDEKLIKYKSLWGEREREREGEGEGERERERATEFFANYHLTRSRVETFCLISWHARTIFAEISAVNLSQPVFTKLSK
jgi:hypothetical protein